MRQEHGAIWRIRRGVFATREVVRVSSKAPESETSSSKASRFVVYYSHVAPTEPMGRNGELSWHLTYT